MRNRSPPEVILANTALAVEDLKWQLETFARGDAGVSREEGKQDVEMMPRELWACRFNAGLFGVEWEKTRQVLVDAGLKVTVVSPAE